MSYLTFPQAYCAPNDFLYPGAISSFQHNLYSWSFPPSTMLCSINLIFPQNIIENQVLKEEDERQCSDDGEKQTHEPKIREANGIMKKKNMRNIIPNLSHKILRYLSSEESKEVLLRIDPSLSSQEITKFYEHTTRLRKSMRFYVGTKDLTSVWYRQTKSPRQAIHHRLIRILSQHFLVQECVSSILLSRRMKPNLKEQHLKCRRKLLALLRKGPKKV